MHLETDRTKNTEPASEGESSRRLEAARPRGIFRALRSGRVPEAGERIMFAFFRASPPRSPWLLLSFVFFVVLPSLVGAVYFSMLAAPQFEVETRLVVRQSEPVDSIGDKLSGMASLGMAFSYSTSAQNAYVVAQFIKSRAAVDDVMKLIDLRAIYQRSEADFWARLRGDATEEDLVEYWREMVRSYVDSTSNIIVVEVRAFRADDALKVAEAIIAVSERVVNDMSSRARQDIVRMSEGEMTRADAILRSTLVELQKARNEEGMLDPMKSADETGRLLIQVMAEKIRLESELYIASRSLNESSPAVRQLKSHLEIVDRQISTLKSSLAGNGETSGNVASSLRRFEQLEVQRFLAEKLLKVAEDGLERARVKADRQNLYFMVFVAPALATKATLPHRLAYSILIPIACLMLWGIGALLYAAIEDHRL